MKLEELQPGASVTGVEPTQIVSVLATVPMGEGSVQLIYRTPDGAMKERLRSRVESMGKRKRRARMTLANWMECDCG